jgi:hypothetical protein
MINLHKHVLNNLKFQFILLFTLLYNFKINKNNSYEEKFIFFNILEIQKNSLKIDFINKILLIYSIYPSLTTALV